eukprot:5262259-Pyramimonas_sp.AAC.3
MEERKRAPLNQYERMKCSHCVALSPRRHGGSLERLPSGQFNGQFSLFNYDVDVRGQEGAPGFGCMFARSSRERMLGFADFGRDLRASVADGVSTTEVLNPNSRRRSSSKRAVLTVRASDPDEQSLACNYVLLGRLSRTI